MATKNDVIRALRRHLPGLQDGLFVVPRTRRILGFVASPAFARLDHGRRQQRIWKAIELEIPRSKTGNIGPITAMTPEEARLHVNGAD